MLATQLLNDIKYQLTVPMMLSELMREHNKLIKQLEWLPEQLALFLAVLPEFTVTHLESGETQISMGKVEITLDLALESLLKEANKPLPTDKLIQQLKEFKTSGPQLLAIAKRHPNMNVIGGRAILYRA
ncbi:hypothetical protein AN391_02510 [Pseudoalteromonas sp. P1-13-1a]|uniref:hypothetical protein n=1 Tax=Pseudoalteromonas sp. P1-13-1a TaxID=1723756 RepID=UPI0006E5D9CE|nr:hypothetical protein [Pseudoalteromonas sp. P1-13-1a]KPZ55753.1 hypothetical protein AN391_02510 [Pseudoalteromonas sp. P1-13-1a]